jgi:hypothetical protein
MINLEGMYKEVVMLQRTRCPAPGWSVWHRSRQACVGVASDSRQDSNRALSESRTVALLMERYVLRLMLRQGIERTQIKELLPYSDWFSGRRVTEELPPTNLVYTVAQWRGLTLLMSFVSYHLQSNLKAVLRLSAPPPPEETFFVS